MGIFRAHTWLGRGVLWPRFPDKLNHLAQSVYMVLSASFTLVMCAQKYRFVETALLSIHNIFSSASRCKNFIQRNHKSANF